MGLLENVMVLNTLSQRQHRDIEGFQAENNRFVGQQPERKNRRNRQPNRGEHRPQQDVNGSLQVVSQCRAHCTERLGGEHQRGDQESGQGYRRA